MKNKMIKIIHLPILVTEDGITIEVKTGLTPFILNMLEPITVNPEVKTTWLRR